MSHREIPLGGRGGAGRVAIVDEADYGGLAGFRWFFIPHRTVGGYAARHGTVCGRRRPWVYMHDQIMQPPAGQEVDHRNNDGLDNRRQNLRLGTRTQNHGNTRKLAPASSRFKGVYWHGQSRRWRADICHSRRRYFLGHFTDEAEAARAYDAAAVRLYGEFARVNFPGEGRV